VTELVSVTHVLTLASVARKTWVPGPEAGHAVLEEVRLEAMLL